GLWYEWAYTDRYQIPSDPRSGLDTVLPNFHEHFITTTFQPFIEYEYRVTRDISFTGGIKLAYYRMDLKQFAANGKTVGRLTAPRSPSPLRRIMFGTPPPTCAGRSSRIGLSTRSSPRATQFLRAACSTPKALWSR